MLHFSGQFAPHPNTGQRAAWVIANKWRSKFTPTTKTSARDQRASQPARHQAHAPKHMRPAGILFVGASSSVCSPRSYITAVLRAAEAVRAGERRRARANLIEQNVKQRHEPDHHAIETFRLDVGLGAG